MASPDYYLMTPSETKPISRPNGLVEDQPITGTLRDEDPAVLSPRRHSIPKGHHFPSFKDCFVVWSITLRCRQNNVRLGGRDPPRGVNGVSPIDKTPTDANMQMSLNKRRLLPIASHLNRHLLGVPEKAQKSSYPRYNRKHKKERNHTQIYTYWCLRRRNTQNLKEKKGDWGRLSPKLLLKKSASSSAHWAWSVALPPGNGWKGLPCSPGPACLEKILDVKDRVSLSVPLGSFD